MLYNMLGDSLPDPAMPKRIFTYTGSAENSYSVSSKSVVFCMSSPYQALMAASRLSIYFV